LTKDNYRICVLLKLPSSKSRQAYIAIEINPVDASGAVTKKR